MAIASRGFNGIAFQYDEASFSAAQARAAEGGYRHVVSAGGDTTPSTGRAVSVAVFDAWVAGTSHVSDAASVVALDANGTTNRRIDYIVLDVDWAADTATVTKVTGTAGATPSPPALTQTAGVRWQMPLARVVVRAGATSISEDDVEVCKPLRRQVRRSRATVPVTSVRFDASSWKNAQTVNVTDPGWPYRLHVMASVRFDELNGGFGMLQALQLGNPDVEYGQAISGVLNNRGVAVLNAVGPDVTGSVRVQLNILSAGDATSGSLSILDHPSNHFTLLQIPA